MSAELRSVHKIYRSTFSQEVLDFGVVVL